ncbi:MAG: hypothetical protein IT385_09935 [Deltaproteobacteria bacterium]|nr:hypothetical protein [Deltaproteobacteria bacterium]
MKTTQTTRSTAPGRTSDAPAASSKTRELVGGIDGFDKQAAALAAPGDWPTLLAQVEAGVKKVDDAFLVELAKNRGALGADGDRRLLAIFRAADTDTKNKIFKAMGAPVGAGKTYRAVPRDLLVDDEGWVLKSKLDAAKFTEPGERITTALRTVTNPTTGLHEPAYKSEGGMLVLSRSFTDAELTVLFEQFLALPAGHREGGSGKPYTALSAHFGSSAFMEGRKEIAMGRMEEGAEVKYARTLRHEIGHALDFRDNPDAKMQADSGWTAYKNVDDVVSALSPFSDKDDPEFQAEAKRIVSVFFEGTRIAVGGTLDAELAQSKKDLAAKAPDADAKAKRQADFVAWWKANKLGKLAEGSRDQGKFGSRETIAGGIAAIIPQYKQVEAASASLTGKLTSWGNVSAAWSEREYAAESYAEWYGTEKPGTSAPAKALPDGTQAWLKKLDPAAKAKAADDGAKKQDKG